MKNWLICILFIFGGETFGQMPHIDSMVVNGPDNDTIYLYGKFSSSLGKIFLDTTVLQVYLWTDTLLEAHLLPFFVGSRPSCGAITVNSKGMLSNPRILDMGWIEGYTYPPGDTLINHESPFDIYWRYDFHSFFLNHNRDKVAIPVNGGKIAEFDFHEHKITFSRVNGSGTNFMVPLDSNYYLPPNGYNYWYRPDVGEWVGYAIRIYCTVPLDARKIFETSLIVEPKNLLLLSSHSIICYFNQITLSYFSPYISCYDLLGRKHHLEFLSTDGTESTYSLRSLAAGVYFVSDGKKIVKFLVGE